jgi:hypothetical protein
MERFGHPSYFREYYDQEWKSKEEYEQAALNGQIDLEVAAGVISGQDKWEQTLDKMIFAFDWITHAQDHLDDKVANEFYKRHNLKNPHAKIQENICKEYVYEILPEEKKRQENETPYVKEFGGLAPEMMSSESDLHIKHPDKYKLLGVKDLYYDYEYEDEKIRKEVDEGLKLFGRFYLSLWD